MNSISEKAFKIQSMALELGYEKCGIIPIDRLNGFNDAFEKRLETVPQSQKFYQSQKRLTEISDNFPWAKSLVILSTSYAKFQTPEPLRGKIARTYLFECRVESDAPVYQNSLKFESFLKSLNLKTATNRKFGVAGLRWAAAQAGLGIIRKNNFFYTKSGSWNHLEGFLIDESLELTEVHTLKPCPDGCGQCLKACPTKALNAPFSLSPTTCVSFLTTIGAADYSKTPIFEQVGSWLYGCDSCQNACPMNKETLDESIPFKPLEEIAHLLTPEHILSLEESTYREKISPHFFYITPDGHWKWKLNALNYLYHHNPQSHIALFEKATTDAHPSVREMAEFILKAL